MFTIGRDRAFLYGHPEQELTAEESARYRAALAQRSRGIPAQYITGHQEFWGMDLIVSPAVLIPRPETEHVIERVLECVGRAPSPARLNLDLEFPDSPTTSGNPQPFAPTPLSPDSAECIRIFLSDSHPTATHDRTIPPPRLGLKCEAAC